MQRPDSTKAMLHKSGLLYGCGEVYPVRRECRVEWAISGLKVVS